MTSLASRVGWAVTAVASATGDCAVAGLSAGAGAQLEGPGSCGPAVALCGCQAGKVVGCLQLPGSAASFLE